MQQLPSMAYRLELRPAESGVVLSKVSDDSSLYQLERWSQLTPLLKAFRAALKLDPSATLDFSRLLTQDNRAHVHKCACMHACMHALLLLL